MKIAKGLILFVMISLVFGCKSDKKADRDVTATDEIVEKKYPLTPVSRSPKFSDAKIESMTYNNGFFDFEISGKSYTLGEQTSDAPSKMCANSKDGQHIHLIVDNLPYAAKYESRFEHQVSDGKHNILAFLSRSYHESIKTEDARVAQRVTVEGGSITDQEDIDQPTLFYSRPKGTYVGEDTKKILLDFYPINVELGDDYKIKVQINGEVSLLDKWEPYFIENLPMGQNTIGIAIVYPDGTPVEGRQTSILQTINLKRDPLPAQ